jgi:hypothetical protein
VQTGRLRHPHVGPFFSPSGFLRKFDGFAQVLFLVRDPSALLADELGFVHKRRDLFNVQFARTAGEGTHLVNFTAFHLFFFTF